MTTFVVTNIGTSYYVIDGNIIPTLNLVRGNSYTFNVSTFGQPFWIKTEPVAGTGSAYVDGVTNNGIDSGNILFTVSVFAPSTLYYAGQNSTSMQGVISISGDATFTETLTDDITLNDDLSINYQPGSLPNTNTVKKDRIKDRVSELINSQLPEFIRNDNTTFVAFLKYYYKFLEQDQGETL
jgi:hypothetical protein